MEDSPASQEVAPKAPIHRLGIQKAFDSLSKKEKLYAHHMSRAAWHGTKIILRQVSPEALGIFEFIMELFSEDEEGLNSSGIDPQELQVFIEYAAKFLSNIGNYFGYGDQKFVPYIRAESLRKIASRSPKLIKLHDQIAQSMLSISPPSLGYPGDITQSAYYPGQLRISKSEITTVSRAMEEHSILPENTRIRKASSPASLPAFEVLQASVEKDETPRQFPLSGSEADGGLLLLRGDHSEELQKICSSLSEAAKYAANDDQKRFISQYIKSFETGDLEAYHDSQRTWIMDKAPRVENIFGFVEPYRDPCGTRAEFEGLVGISDIEETKPLKRLVENSTKFIKRLPWAQGTWENGGKGPFEKELFEPPDFVSIHTLAYCSSIISTGINLPNYNDIRQEHGFKNLIISNRMSAENNKTAEIYPFIDPSEADTFMKHKYPAYYWWVVLHELLGHGTGKMMVQEEGGKYNFDVANPPRNPLSGRPISSWYKPGQTWTGQFEDLATTVDECRSELVGAYLMDDIDLLGLFGFSGNSEITAGDLTYNLYLQLGVDGLKGLQNFNLEDRQWGQAHSQAHFAILKCLLNDGDGFMTVEYNLAEERLLVRVDRSKIVSHGKSALGGMLLRLHMYRCTADVPACREYYEDLSKVEGKYLEWRQIVLAKKQPEWVFVQANTFLDGGDIILKEYEATNEGVIRSWVERAV